MNIKKGIVGILIIVLILAVFFQIIRSNYLLTLFTNMNSPLTNHKYVSASVPDKLQKEKYLVVFDDSEPNSITIKNNVEKTLAYMKKSTEIVNVKDVYEVDSSNKAVVITFERLDKINNLSSLKDYVKGGGKLFLAERPIVNTSLMSILDMLGIDSISEEKPTKGMKLLSNVLIKGTNLSIGEGVVTNSSMIVTLNKKAEVLAESIEKVPILWKVSYEKGTIIVFNGSNLSEKINRGIIAGSISMLFPDFIYPIMDAKLMYIDDFPAPVPLGYNAEVYKEYGVTVPQFYRDIWWPDILKGSKMHDIKYIGTIIETYNNNTTPPFKNVNNDTSKLLLYGRELLRSGGELGIHGYNHQSLAPENYIKQSLNYSPWKSEDDMEQAISEVNRYASSAYPKYSFRVYVPPSNILSDEGKYAIKKSMKDLKVISSIYINNYLGDSYAQEFEIKDGIAELPRLTSGYKYDELTKWTAYNGITSIGVFSHFIHPDDVLDSGRSQGKTWSKLSKEYNLLLADISDNFPWLKSVTASKGAELLNDYSYITPEIEYTDKEINVYCKNFGGDGVFILRSNSKVYPNKDCTISEVEKGVYIINAKAASFSIKKE